MKGLLELLLLDRYGEPIVVACTPHSEYRWNNAAETLSCILYKSADFEDAGTRFPILHPLYGDAVGGFLLGDSLKLSMLQGPKVFGLYQIAELQAHPEVRHANSLDPTICFFMDSANVWYYGSKDDQLYVYDSETDELDSLGPVRSGLEQLLTEWEQAKL